MMISEYFRVIGHKSARGEKPYHLDETDDNMTTSSSYSYLQ